MNEKTLMSKNKEYLVKTILKMEQEVGNKAEWHDPSELPETGKDVIIATADGCHEGKYDHSGWMQYKSGAQIPTVLAWKEIGTYDR